MQADEGFSLDAQLQRLRDFCAGQDWQVVGVYTDAGASAKDTERPELQRMMQAIVEGAMDVVVVYKLDRLTRSVLDLYELLQFFEDHKVGFRSVTEVFDTTSAMGRLFVTIVAALAQWEREQLGERTKAGMIEMTRQGRWSGGRAAFGYSYDGELHVNESQAEVVRDIFEWYTSGLGLRTILARLNDPSHPRLAPRQAWTLNALKYCLRNPLYAGYVRYGYRTVGGRRTGTPLIQPGQHEPIISRDLWEKAEQMRKERATFPVRAGTGSFPFSGVLRCSLCGAAMSGNTVTRKGRSYRYYVCGTSAHSGLCPQKPIREDKVEGSFLSALKEYRDRLSVASEGGVPRNMENTMAALQTELKQAKLRRSRWMDAFGDGVISGEELREHLDATSERIRRLESEIVRLEEASGADLQLVRDLALSFEQVWPLALPVERKELLRSLVDRMYLEPEERLRVVWRV